MLFFDPNNPNKYKRLKKLLVPYSFDIKKTKVGSGDGGYVIHKKNTEKVLSYGIGNDPKGVSFDTECLKLGAEVHMYDGAIKSFPLKIEGNGKFFSEYLNEVNFRDHVEKLNIENPEDSVLKMDIEGCEYDWLTDENLNILTDNFAQFTIEVHALIEEIPEGWVLEPQLLEAKQNPQKVIKFFERLNEEFTLWHIHGNNHAPRYVDFPDSLELTYLNNNYYSDNNGIDYSDFPIEGLDEPNFEGREDYKLDWWA